MGKIDMTEKSCKEFVEVLASKSPVPGGGGAAALAGALGTALGEMVGSLTVGKKKYADVQEDVLRLKEEAQKLEQEFLHLVERDAEVFEPLSKAYGLPKDTGEQKAHKAQVMEAALKEACTVPMQIMECCCKAIDLVREMETIGTAIAISDAGCAAAYLRAALTSASLNVYINTKSMKDRDYAGKQDQYAAKMLEEYVPICDEVFEKVKARVSA
ncbi:MAG: cyclodeaminase/cyclohydrolase family protein [Clostridiales bacterium]|nr:cyclodeaminase/cyclohydrolase family protein [Clostridiales bacterium]